MKFRTDFVTNSSSSSFIFQRKFSDEDICRLHAQLAAKYKKARFSPDYEELKYYFEYTLQNIKTIDKFSPEVLAEVISWYRDELISKLIGNSNPDDFEIHTLSDEKLRILAGIWYFDYFVNRYCHNNKEYVPPTCDLLEEYVWDYLTVSFQYDDELLAILIADNGERFMNALVAVAKMPLPEIFEMITGGKYMQYDSLEKLWLISEILREDENCLWGCNHMG